MSLTASVCALFRASGACSTRVHRGRACRSLACMHTWSTDYSKHWLPISKPPAITDPTCMPSSDTAATIKQLLWARQPMNKGAEHRHGHHTKGQDMVASVLVRYINRSG